MQLLSTLTVRNQWRGKKKKKRKTEEDREEEVMGEYRREFLLRHNWVACEVFSRTFSAKLRPESPLAGMHLRS